MRGPLLLLCAAAGATACPASCPTFSPDSCASTITLSPSSSLTYSCGGTSCRTGGTVDDSFSFFTSNPGGDLASCPYWSKTVQDPESIVQFDVAFSAMYTVEALPGPTPSPGLDIIMQLRTCTNVSLACDDNSGTNANYPLATQYLFAGIQYVVIVEKKAGTSVTPNFLLKFTRLASGSSGCPVSCPTSYPTFNNGVCDKVCASDSCQRDNGACAPVPTACPVNCPLGYVGDGFCDGFCNVADCLFDRGDCPTSAPTINSGTCPTGCPAIYRGDGFCDTICNLASCNYDDGDCGGVPTPYPSISTVNPYCPSSCPPSSLSNGVCDSVCSSYYCSYDGGDCLNSGAYSGLYASALIISLIPVFVIVGLYLIAGIVILVFHNNGNDLKGCGVLWFGRPRHRRVAGAGGMVLRPAPSQQFNPQYSSQPGMQMRPVAAGAVPQNVMVVQPHVMQVQAYIPTAQPTMAPAPGGFGGGGMYPTVANPQYAYGGSVPTAKVAMEDPPL